MRLRFYVRFLEVSDAISWWVVWISMNGCMKCGLLKSIGPKNFSLLGWMVAMLKWCLIWCFSWNCRWSSQPTFCLRLRQRPSLTNSSSSFQTFFLLWWFLISIALLAIRTFIYWLLDLQYLTFDLNYQHLKHITKFWPKVLTFEQFRSNDPVAAGIAFLYNFDDFAAANLALANQNES